jgi:hypothetical protein
MTKKMREGTKILNMTQKKSGMKIHSMMKWGARAAFWEMVTSSVAEKVLDRPVKGLAAKKQVRRMVWCHLKVVYHTLTLKDRVLQILSWAPASNSESQMPTSCQTLHCLPNKVIIWMGNPLIWPFTIRNFMKNAFALRNIKTKFSVLHL